LGSVLLLIISNSRKLFEDRVVLMLNYSHKCRRLLISSQPMSADGGCSSVYRRRVIVCYGCSSALKYTPSVPKVTVKE